MTTTSPSSRDERGFVTAETAVVLPALVLLLAVVLSLVHAASVQSGALDAAGIGARTAARGDADAAVLAAARRVLPAGGSVDVRRGHGLVTVDVRVPLVQGSVLTHLLGALTVQARAAAVDESVP